MKCINTHTRAGRCSCARWSGYRRDEDVAFFFLFNTLSRFFLKLNMDSEKLLLFKWSLESVMGDANVLSLKETKPFLWILTSHTHTHTCQNITWENHLRELAFEGGKKIWRAFMSNSWKLRHKHSHFKNLRENKGDKNASFATTVQCI